ncbi:MAG: clostripain-related cysteine peptidase, partial [Candidatus Thermoplasmatota archaeon]
DISSSFGNELNMGDALVARSFILYTIKNYPAKKYIQIYEGHAGGFGFSYDGESSDTLSISEMPDVFSPAVSAIGKRIDAVLIFGCLMGNIEFFYELAPFADFVGAAQTYSYPTPLREFGRILTSKYYADARSISRDLANAYGNSWFSYSYTVVDTSKMDEIMGPIDAYSLALLKYDKNELTELRDKAKEMAGGYPKYSSLREFYQFVQYTKEKDKLKESAEGVLSVIKNPIIAKTGSYNGFSIYFPKGEAHPEFTYDFNKYKRLRFSSKTHWDEFIENYMKEGVVYLQLGIPVDKLILINQSKAQHNFFIASRTYNGENPFVLMVKTKNEEDIKKFNIIVIMNSLAYMGGSKRYEWYYTSNNMNALVIIPKEQVNEKKNFEISVIVKGYPGEKIIYSIAAYAEFEKVDENNIEQIAWSGNIARKDGNLRKTNDEKYYFVLIPANKKINIKLNYIGTSNETDFDLYVGISPPHGMGLPRIYQFDYRGFTIDANETVPMKGSIGGYDKEVK